MTHARDPFQWTPERTRQLVKMWKAGLSTAEIGAHFGVSAHSISGKTNRLARSGQLRKDRAIRGPSWQDGHTPGRDPYMPGSERCQKHADACWAGGGFPYFPTARNGRLVAVWVKPTPPAPRITTQPVVRLSESIPDSIVEIVHAVAQAHGVAPTDITGQALAKRAVHARQEAICRAWDTGKHSLQKIARYFGNRHHTTIMASIAAHRARVAQMEQAA